jgi:hypothetical protein
VVSTQLTGTAEGGQRLDLRIGAASVVPALKGQGAPVKLANGMLALDGISRRTKRRALLQLERHGLISIERRPKKSPIVHLADLDP